MKSEISSVTVFTPTYNRAYSLPRVFNSLKQQTVKNFEWIIVDDGSGDDTRQLVDQWRSEADFPIIYEWQPNQGKHIAFNKGVKLAKGELFMTVDSDDEIIPEALEILLNCWQRVGLREREFVAGILFVSKDQHGNIVGDMFPEHEVICDIVELLLVKKIKGDKAAIMQTKVVKMYPFPEEVKNELVPEMVFIHQLSHDWKLICINEALRIYWIDERADHLGNSFMGTKSYNGIRLSYLALLNYSIRFFWKAPKTFLANAAYYTKTSLYLKINLRKQGLDIVTRKGRIIWLLTLPAGYMLYLKQIFRK